MVNVFIGDWYKCLKAKSLGSSWLQHYPAPPPTKRRRLASNVRLYHPASVKNDRDNGGLDPSADEGLDLETDEGLNLDTEYDLNHINPDLLEGLMED